MPQHIDLCPPHRRHRPHAFSRSGAALLVVLGVGAVIALQQLETHRIAQRDSELQRARAESTRLQRLLTEVPSPSAGQAERLASEEQALAALEKVAARLSAGSFGTATGFAPHLRALARTTHDGVWLTSIKVDLAGGVLQLEGRALDAARVPAWIGGFKREPLLAATPFQAFEIRSDDKRDAGAPLAFRLQSTPRSASPATGAPTSTLTQAMAGGSR